MTNIRDVTEHQTKQLGVNFQITAHNIKTLHFKYIKLIYIYQKMTNIDKVTEQKLKQKSSIVHIQVIDRLLNHTKKEIKLLFTWIFLVKSNSIYFSFRLFIFVDFDD
jgi:hypothetical protein